MCIDPNKIKEYVGDVSDAECYAMLTSFRKSLQCRQKDLQNALKLNNWQECAQLTHNLKSNALYFGAEKLQEICQTGEKLFTIATTDTQDIHIWLDKFNQQCQRVLSGIDSVLKDKRHAQETRK